MKESAWRLAAFKDEITYCEDSYFAVEGSDAVVILTEWNQFRGLNLEKMLGSMKDNYFFDFRNIYVSESSVRHLFKYFPVGIAESSLFEATC